MQIDIDPETAMANLEACGIGSHTDGRIVIYLLTERACPIPGNVHFSPQCSLKRLPMNRTECFHPGKGISFRPHSLGDGPTISRLLGRSMGLTMSPCFQNLRELAAM